MMRNEQRATGLSDSFYIAILFALAIIFCSFNLFNGFGEVPDSVRMVESALKAKRLHHLVPSRTWGYPLYETFSYRLISYFFPNLLPAKLFSLAILFGTLYFLFRILTALQLDRQMAFLLCLVFLCNPLVIISGNTVMETGLSIFFLTVILYYFVRTTPGKKLKLSNYVSYALLFGLATLVRPDNMLYFPSIFIFLFLRKEFNIGYIIISGLIFVVVGILPFFMVGYPIFKPMSSGIPYNPLAVVKNLLAIFGIPFLLSLITTAILMYRSLIPELRKVFTWSNELLRFLAIVTILILIRTLRLADELEYSLFIWPMAIVVLGMVVKELALSHSARVNRALVFLAIACFLPNLVQIYFFKEVDFKYKFSVGLTSGVFEQDRNRRLLNEQVYFNSKAILLKASDSLRKKEINYVQHIHYKNCDSCIVLTTVRSFKTYQQSINATGTDLKRQRIVYAFDFNFSRGWRNFIQDNYMPTFTEKTLVLLK